MPTSKNAKKTNESNNSYVKIRCNRTFAEFIVVIQFLLTMAGFTAVLYHVENRLERESKMLEEKTMQYYTQLNDKINQFKAMMKNINENDNAKPKYKENTEEAKQFKDMIENINKSDGAKPKHFGNIGLQESKSETFERKTVIELDEHNLLLNGVKEAKLINMEDSNISEMTEDAYDDSEYEKDKSVGGNEEEGKSEESVPSFLDDNSKNSSSHRYQQSVPQSKPIIRSHNGDQSEENVPPSLDDNSKNFLSRQFQQSAAQLKPAIHSLDGDLKRMNISTFPESNVRKRSPRLSRDNSKNSVQKFISPDELLKSTTGIPAIHLQAYCSPDIKCSTNKTKYPQKTYVHWKPDPWYHNSGMEQDIKFINSTGEIKVIKDGIYFVYAQLMYYTQKSADGYYLYKNNQPILECIVSTEGNKNRSCTCFTGGIMQFNDGDLLKIEAPEKEHIVYLEATKSYWGMFKLGGF